MNQLKEVLRSVELFSGLNESMLETLAANCVRIRRDRGVTVVYQNEPGVQLYVIVKGRVAVIRTNEHGEETFLAERGPGDCFGEMSLLDGSRRFADVKTTTPCEFLMLERDTFMRCLRDSPELALRIMATLVQRIRETDDKMARRAPVRARLAAELGVLADRYGVKVKNGTRIESSMTITELADRIQAAREVVSRTLTALQNDGMVARDGRSIVILDRTRLDVEAAK